MKVLVVLSALVACSVATGVIAPAALGYSAVGPLAYAAHAPVVTTYAAHAPVVHAAPAVTTYAAHAPVVHAAPAVTTYAAAAPVVHAASVAVAPAAVRTQYHAQDVHGQASYGHAEPLQAHHAVQDAAGNKVGSFSYVSPEGSVLRTDYVADGLGYRVASNALPVGPGAAVVDTPAVVAARAAHLAAHHVVRRQIAIGHTPAATAPLVHAVAPVAHSVYAAPLAHSVVAPTVTYAAAAPYAYSVPAVRPATLTTVVNTPGHAVSYRVD